MKRQTDDYVFTGLNESIFIHSLDTIHYEKPTRNQAPYDSFLPSYLCQTKSMMRSKQMETLPVEKQTRHQFPNTLISYV